MSSLTADEQTTLCTELTQSLSASFGSPEVSCELGSHSGTRQGMAPCESWYSDCVASAPAMATVSACTAMNTDMFSCPITVAQYTACFNATNAVLLREIEAVPACSAQDPGVQPTADEMTACANAQCDYVWFD
ncbi:MAG TPA: hypothetical protein VMJ10_02355 [Kofleriaceae bacterium]|nr:hypothetical protein [Kofleriaceae bacterium]